MPIGLGRAGEIGPLAERDDQDIGTIEIELLKLDRYVEMFGRRTDLYRLVDRSGYLALRTLDHAGPLSVNALSEALGLHPSTVTRQVKRLEANGFVSRRTNRNDQRSSTIVLNPAGRRIMATVETERLQRIKSLLSEWSREERRSLGGIMAKLNMTIANSEQYREVETGRLDRAARDQAVSGE